MTKPLQDLRILLVEDDPIIGLDLRETLELAGATVLGPTHDVAGTFAVLQEAKVDAAVLDHLIIGGSSVPSPTRSCSAGWQSCSTRACAEIWIRDILPL